MIAEADRRFAPGGASARPIGFNVIGHVNGNLGLGIAARNVARLIAQRRLPLAIHNLPIDAARLLDDAQVGDLSTYFVADAARLPYAINLFVVGADQLYLHWTRHRDEYLRPDALNAALVFWEIPSFPPRWQRVFEQFDVMVAASDFMRYAFQLSLSGPSTIAARVPVDLPGDVAADRARFGLPHDATIFVTGFDANSDIERKNTAAAIEAFRRGAVDRPLALLVVKVSNPAGNGAEHAAAREVLARCADDPRIRIVSTPFSYAEVLSLYASCDVYVSLHRAEGLGLGLAEAMLLGKPVIATDWSGNLTFMDHGNACLVRTVLVPVAGTHRNYSQAELEDTTRWADPDVAHAAAWMRRLTDDPTLRESIGRAAGRRLQAYNDDARRGDFLDQLDTMWHSKIELGVRTPTRESAPENLVRHGRLARIQELERELHWIKSRLPYRFAAAVKALVSIRRGDGAGS